MRLLPKALMKEHSRCCSLPKTARLHCFTSRVVFKLRYVAAGLLFSKMPTYVGPFSCSRVARTSMLISFFNAAPIPI
jgi:hypothetical protein